MDQPSQDDEVWLEDVALRLNELAWKRASDDGVDLHVELGTNAKWVDIYADRTALLIVAASCLKGALSEGPLWSHSVDEASYANPGSLPVEFHRASPT
ncbi:hypothetical protein [Brevundimonas sp.]|uniref:hypothetical protein n=1 Tax=Brevundimonas sp. TaxID=1871086 RepID=UPI002D446FBD|nr:hypothetical protein [Brevundimonas sp.]HYD27790.1 hypothetical protein [Brevundimonas sp.]